VLTINDPDSLNNDAGVTSVAISPDGRWVAAGSLDTVVRIWDVSSGQLVERLRGHRDSVYSVAFTPDGKGLVSGSLDKTLKYWDVSGLNGSSGSGSANGSVKGKKEGSQAPNGGPSGPGASGAVVKKDEKGGRVSECTMNFIGHKVSTNHSLLSSISHTLSPHHRTTSCPSPSRTTAYGSSPAPKTEAYNSGTHALRLCSACCRDTRTVSSLSISVPRGMYWLQAAGIGKRGYGVMGVFRVLMKLEDMRRLLPNDNGYSIPYFHLIFLLAFGSSCAFVFATTACDIVSQPRPPIDAQSPSLAQLSFEQSCSCSCTHTYTYTCLPTSSKLSFHFPLLSLPLAAACCCCIFLLVCFHSYQLKMLPSLISCYMFV